MNRVKPRPGIELAALAVLVVCYLLIATRGGVVTWLWR